MKRAHAVARATAVLSSLLLATLAREARAGGMYVTDRGVAPMGRGGAYVAGARDLHSLWYNPAGLADAGNDILLDASYVNYSTEFTRRTQVVDQAGVARVFEYPTVQSSTPFVPIPTLALSHAFTDRITAAIGMMVPYAALQSFPDTAAGQPAASRYSLLSLDGSTLVKISAGGAFKIHERVRVGASVQLLAGSFTARVMSNANPADRFLGASEDPTYDSESQATGSPILAPSGNLGATFVLHENLRLGLAGQLPFWVNAPATLKARLPDHPLFDNARQTGEEARIKFRFPAIVRAGLEFSKQWEGQRRLSVEVAYVREFWSMHDSIDIETKNVTLEGVTGFPSPFYVADIRMPRNFKDVNSFRLGGDYTFPGIGGHPLTLRAGASYETSAIDPAWVTPLTPDADKLIASVGIGVNVTKGLRFDAMYTKPIYFGVDVDPAEAKVPRISPLQGNPVEGEAINGGRYRMSANIIGLGASLKY